MTKDAKYCSRIRQNATFYMGDFSTERAGKIVSHRTLPRSMITRSMLSPIKIPCRRPCSRLRCQLLRTGIANCSCAEILFASGHNHPSRYVPFSEVHTLCITNVIGGDSEIIRASIVQANLVKLWTKVSPVVPMHLDIFIYQSFPSCALHPTH